MHGLECTLCLLPQSDLGVSAPWAVRASSFRNSVQPLLTICPGAMFGWFRLPSWAAAGLRYSSDCRDVFLVFSGNLDDIKRYQMIWLSNDLQRSHYPLSNTFPAPKVVYPTPRIPLFVRCIRDVRCIRKTKTHYPIIALLRGSHSLSVKDVIQAGFKALGL